MMMMMLEEINNAILKIKDECGEKSNWSDETVKDFKLLLTEKAKTELMIKIHDGLLWAEEYEKKNPKEAAEMAVFYGDLESEEELNSIQIHNRDCGVNEQIDM